ncbi:MAG: TonB-dependent receptor [Halioglobus sp.]|jgi:TonB-dependent receptor
MSTIPSRKRLIASAIASYTLMTGCGLAMAQEANDAPQIMEDVIVTGIKGSLTRAMDVKRDSQGVVEALSAEDIGKMPDTNLAESLQRITGVSIDRVNGEGSRVTVRGFGPDYNVITLNSRQMPAANIEATTASASRSYDFSNLAAESVSGVQVYKTGRANISTGGIGSVINILTHRPLDHPDGAVNISAKVNSDSTNKDGGDDYTPEISGIFSRNFADGKFGVALTASFAARDSGFAQGGTGNGWYTIPGGQGDWGSIPSDSTTFVNPPQEGTVYSVPRNLSYAFGQVQRERTNAQLTLQWAPIASVQATLDYTYSEQDIEQQQNDMGSWFNGNPTSGAFTSGDSGVVSLTQYNDSTGNDSTFGVGEWGTKSENKSLGFNIEWDATDNLTLEFDYHDSSAENGAKDDRGTNNIISGVQFDRIGNSVDYTQDLPIANYQYSNPLDPSRMLTSGTSFRNSFMEHDIEQFQLKGVFRFDDSMVRSIDFGISATESENRSAYSNAQRDTWSGYGTPEDFDDSLFKQASLSGEFDDIDGSNSKNLEPFYYRTNFSGTRQALADLATANGDSLGPCGVVLCANPVFEADRTTVEEQLGAYVQANFAWENQAMPMHLTLGVRYEETDVDSKALVPFYSELVWAGDNEFTANFSDSDFTSDEGSYSNWLPNIDFDIEVVENVVLRASSSITITRPSYTDLQGGKTINNPVRFGGGTGAQGNPNLKPFESTNFDFSAEWYYAEGSYVSVGYYTKDVENFIGNTTVASTVFELAHPAQGPRYDDAVATLGTNDAAQVRAYMDALYGAPVAGDASLGDPSTVFSLVTPVNAETATIDGWELAFQHMFGESGFGLIANYTFVDGDIEYDNNNTNKGENVENQFALLGLSDSANFIGFYDKNGFQARIAYNWRDDFLAATVDGNGERNPIYTQDYAQWDINVSYEVSDSFSVFAEGINITEENFRQYGRDENMVILAIDQGARYAIGVRYVY